MRWAAFLLGTMAACGGGTIATSDVGPDGGGTSDSDLADGAILADSGLKDADPRCPTTRPPDGEPCSPLGLRCRRACTPDDFISGKLSWDATCTGRSEATAHWSVGGIMCRPDTKVDASVAD